MRQPLRRRARLRRGLGLARLLQRQRLQDAQAADIRIEVGGVRRVLRRPGAVARAEPGHRLQVQPVGQHDVRRPARGQPPERLRRAGEVLLHQADHPFQLVILQIGGVQLLRPP